MICGARTQSPGARRTRGAAQHCSRRRRLRVLPTDSMAHIIRCKVLTKVSRLSSSTLQYYAIRARIITHPYGSTARTTTARRAVFHLTIERPGKSSELERYGADAAPRGLSSTVALVAVSSGVLTTYDASCCEPASGYSSRSSTACLCAYGCCRPPSLTFLPFSGSHGE